MSHVICTNLVMSFTTVTSIKAQVFGTQVKAWGHKYPSPLLFNERRNFKSLNYCSAIQILSSNKNNILIAISMTSECIVYKLLIIRIIRSSIELSV